MRETPEGSETEECRGDGKRKKKYSWETWRQEDGTIEWNLEILTKLSYGVNMGINFPKGHLDLRLRANTRNQKV